MRSTYTSQGYDIACISLLWSKKHGQEMADEANEHPSVAADAWIDIRSSEHCVVRSQSIDEAAIRGMSKDDTQCASMRQRKYEQQ